MPRKNSAQNGGSSLIMRCPARALPFLREAFRKADKPEAKQATALMLGILGDSTGAKRLADSLEGKVKRFRLRKGDAYGGEGMDRIGLPLALGRTKAPCALRPLLNLLAETDPVKGDLRDVRAVTLALEALGDPAAPWPSTPTPFFGSTTRSATSSDVI